MVSTNKQFYEAPSTTVFEVKTEGAILQTSGDPLFMGFGDEEEL